jgi:crotonobetainyl-CoA:carnitine CoA-transferase CaiB-like acyl-CoA transferase
MSATGAPDGEPGGGPMKVGPSIVDILTSQYATTAVLAALYHRDHNGGTGQHIDMALMDSGVAALSHLMEQYLVSGVQPPRRGTAGNGGVPSQSFKCSDGKYVMLTVGNEKQWARFCDVLKRPDLMTDDRFNKGIGRILNRDALIPILYAVFETRPLADWLRELDAAEIPCGAINDFDAVFKDPQVIHRGLKVEAPHSIAGTIPMVKNPICFSETPIDSTVPAPLLGEHTQQVLREKLNLSADAIAQLSADKII